MVEGVASEASLQARLQRIFEDAGCTGFLCVRDVDGDSEAALDGDTVVVAASVFKVAVALEFFRQAADGDLDPAERVRIDPRESIGAPAGLSLFSDEIEVSLRDLAVSMLTVSDAIATDVLLARVGLDRVNDLTRSLDLRETVVVTDVKGMCDGLASEIGFGSWRDFAAHAWNDADETARALERMRTSSVCDPAQATRTTAREMAQLLVAIWRDEAAPPQACAQVRSLMAKQLQRDRIARGFGDVDVRFSGKTGTFGGAFRNEIGVVEYADGGRYAVAVFTRAHELYQRQFEIDAAIGAAARVAVESVRRSG